MTPAILSTDIGTAWLLLGLSLLTIGATVIGCVRSSWAENRAQEAERIILSPAPVADFPPTVRAEMDAALAIAKHTSDALDRASVTPLRTGFMVPVQRRGDER